MPGMYVALPTHYGLGADPYDPRNNILAGTAYLREMYDSYGPAGFLAAYNAGPGRYGKYLATGRPLPEATRAYVAKLDPIIAGFQAGDSGRSVFAAFGSTQSPAFIAQSGAALSTDQQARTLWPKRSLTTNAVVDLSDLIPPSNGVFFARSLVIPR